jgi:arylsulfatase
MLGGFTVTAEVQDGTDGVVCALGDLNDGFALYLLGRRPVVTVVAGGATTRLAAPAPMPAGVARIGLSATSGLLELSVDGAVVASGRHGGLLMFPGVGTAAGGLLIGRDRGIPVSEDYTPPFPLTGTVRKVTFESARPRAARPAAEEIDRAQRAD